MPPAPVRLYLGEVDLERRVLEGPSGVVRLSPTEARLLGFLAAHPQREFSADDLLTEVWGYRPGVRSRTVTTTMQRLRAKVEVDPSKPRHLLTVDAGYTFVPLESHEDGEETLVGRQEVLTSVLAALRARTPLVTVTGPGGVGKTRLAREIAARAAGAEVSAVHLVELEDVDQPDEVIQRTGTALSLQGTVTAKRIRQALAGRAPALLVLDDLDRLADHARSAVEPLLGAPGVSVLVTSRRALAHPDEHGFALGPLAPEASRLVLSRVAAQAGATLEGQPDSVLGKLCEALDHLPLALVLAGAWLAHLSPEALLRNVEDLGSSEVGRHGSLEACLAASWDQLPADQRDDLCALALVGPSLPVDLAQTVLGAASLPRLEALRARSLVALEGRRVRILGTVRRFVEPRTAPELRKRVAEAWHQWAVTLAADFDGIGRVEPAEARRVVDALPLALAILDEEPPRPGWDEAVVSLTHLQLTTGFDEGIHRRVARLVGTAEARGDRDALATALHLRSQIEGRTGGEALEDLRAAIALADPDGGPARHFTVDLGAMLRLRRDLTGAREALEQALQRSRAAADPIVEARALLELGMLHRAREAHAEAVDVLRQAARLARRVGYRRLEMIAMGARATNERHLDHPLEAERLLRGAIAMAEELSDLDNVAHLKGNLANLAALDDRPAEAVRLCREALAHYRAHGNVRSEGFALLGLANGELGRGRTDEAVDWLVEARDAFALARLKVGEAYAVANLGRIHHHLGETVAARQRYAEAARVLGDGGEAATVRFRALAVLAALDEGDIETARDEYTALPLQEPPRNRALARLLERGFAAVDDADGLEAFLVEVRDLVGSMRLDRDYDW